jgi:hypothetical protein
MRFCRKLFAIAGPLFSVAICTAFVADRLPKKLVGIMAVGNRLLGQRADVMRYPCTDISFIRSELLHPWFAKTNPMK